MSSDGSARPQRAPQGRRSHHLPHHRTFGPAGVRDPLGTYIAHLAAKDEAHAARRHSCEIAATDRVAAMLSGLIAQGVDADEILRILEDHLRPRRDWWPS